MFLGFVMVVFEVWDHSHPGVGGSLPNKPQ